MICRVKSIALAVALCVAGVMVAQGRDFGLVSIPDALNPQPRPEDVYECTISGKTWFGCTYERRGDGDLVIYEGAVVVEGAYFVVWFALPPTQPLNREVMDILAQIRLRPGRETKVRKVLEALPGWTKSKRETVAKLPEKPRDNGIVYFSGALEGLPHVNVRFNGEEYCAKHNLANFSIFAFTKW